MEDGAEKTVANGEEHSQVRSYLGVDNIFRNIMIAPVNPWTDIQSSPFVGKLYTRQLRVNGV